MLTSLYILWSSIFNICPINGLMSYVLEMWLLNMPRNKPTMKCKICVPADKTVWGCNTVILWNVRNYLLNSTSSLSRKLEYLKLEALERCGSWRKECYLWIIVRNIYYFHYIPTSFCSIFLSLTKAGLLACFKNSNIK